MRARVPCGVLHPAPRARAHGACEEPVLSRFWRLARQAAAAVNASNCTKDSGLGPEKELSIARVRACVVHFHPSACVCVSSGLP